MRRSDVIILTPPGHVDASLAIAASRAGARGFLDLEFAEARDAAWAEVERLQRFTRTEFGVKLGSGGTWLVPRLGGAGPRLAWVLLAGGPDSGWEDWANQLRQGPFSVWFEAVSLEEAVRAEQWGVDGIVLKGHEAGGRVGTDSTFILLQKWGRYLDQVSGQAHPPVWVQGGVGLNTAAACLAGGAAGVVLDAQVLLARESPLGEPARRVLATFDGSETACLGERAGETYRVWARPGLAAVEGLRAWERSQADSLPEGTQRRDAWRNEVRERVGSGPDASLWMLGQHACLAQPLADRYGTVAGIVGAIAERVDQQCEAARRLQPLAEGSPLAVRQGTRYPIVQGPMTRVSDTAPFAEAVARAGALPFLALALMRREESDRLLGETRQRLGDRPWGVGILGFAPPDVRREQIEAIRAHRPPFALIAGGRPDQARELERAGIPTYLHVPSPGLLRMFVRDGARRFIFEGRECGGHVGPRTSLVLWETMVGILLDHLGASGSGEEFQVLFAGGIHDDRSAAMVATLAAPLAERGVGIGVLLGTAYLFTEEAVATGAIVPAYQLEALRCRETVLLEAGPGHAIRCVRTPYAESFEREKRRLQDEGRSPDEIREALETLNVGRLRIATKGVDRDPSGNGNGRRSLVAVPEADQRERGLHMIGQVATLRDRVVTMAELHEEIAAGSTRRLAGAVESLLVDSPPKAPPCDVAIVGMAGFFPGAGDVRTYWRNVLDRVDAIIEVPPDHWDWRTFYDADPKARDKISSKWGGFLDDVPFDPLAFGMPPNSLTAIEPVQLLLLEATRRALADAGYAERPFDRERTAVVLGAGGGAAQLSMAYGFRTYLPMLESVPALRGVAAEIMARTEGLLPEWTEDSFPGILVNVAAGRVANRFNLGGPNFAVDAACGSSLAALYAGVRELETGSSDTALVLGADTVQNPVTYMAFSKTPAFSPRGRCSTFDASADGIVISEGVAAVVLKRLADAERDGDRIYAVIKGVGASSDGKDRGLTAPRPEGQVRAIRRAFERAGISPARVGFVEAHGTGTVVGDQTEVEALGRIFREAGAADRACAIGSVKSMIGHTKCAAGLAGLINASLALHHKVLPPLRVERPNPRADFDHSPFFLNTEPRPWVHGGSEPRSAGVSAFGFGGTNFHAVLEEYTGDYLDRPRAALDRWPAELMVWRRPDLPSLIAAARECRDALRRGAAPDLGALALTTWKASSPGPGGPCLAIVASSLDDLKDKLEAALTALTASPTPEPINDPRGIYFAAAPAERSGRVAFLFPGQGSQYPNMLTQLALAFPEVRRAFDDAERVLEGQLDRPLGKLVFPPSPFTPEQEEAAHRDLVRTEVAQPALGAASLGALHLLKRLGIEPDLVAGHSYGELVALCAAGVIAESDLIRLSFLRGRAIREAGGTEPGGMVMVEAGREQAEPVLATVAGLNAANLNGPKQTVLSGTEDALAAALEHFRAAGLRCQRLPVACAFHSPLVAPARERFAGDLEPTPLAAPAVPVFSNTTAAPYPDDPTAVRSLLASQLAEPVRFQDEVEALYDAGARIFVEVGPQAVLTGLVASILGDRPHLALATDLKRRPGLVQLAHVLGQLLCGGVPVRLDRLFGGRDLPTLDLAHLGPEPAAARLSPSTWLVNSVRVKPAHGPEPRFLGRADVPLAETSTPVQAAAPTNGHLKGSRNGNEFGRLLPPPVPASPVREAAMPAPPGEPTLPSVPPSIDQADAVMLRFQGLMERFLETQQSVMLQYLRGAGAPSQPAVPLVGPEPLSSAESPDRPAVPPTTPEPAPAIPPPETVSTPVEEESLPEGSDREVLTARLLEIVSKRTGYPPEMLGLDLDLEADLGIDSIKRVEILGSLAEANGHGHIIQQEMEKLTGIKSLRGLIDCLMNSSGDAPLPDRNGHAAGSGARDGLPAATPIRRMLIRACDAPLRANGTIRGSGGTVLLTDDGRGVAERLAERLRECGHRSLVLRRATDEPAAVEQLLADIRGSGGPIAGLIHLLPLAGPLAGEADLERMRREVQSLFLLARGLAQDLRQAGRQGPAWLLAATAMGGAFGTGTDPLPPDFFPGQGGVAGLVKGLAHEWPEVLVRVVDCEGDEPAETLADRLLAELGATGDPVEIGYRAGRRITLECVPAPLPSAAGRPAILGPESNLLVTGGARGITAAVVLELARRYRPNLVLIGRSELPPETEAEETAALSDPAALKAALAARLRREGRLASPAAIESAYRRLVRDREIRTNLARLRATGARVQYVAADVRDEAALAAIIAESERRHGPIDGVIHGAGVIQDKLIRDKTPESFDHVFGTKVESALALSRLLRPEHLKFCVFFASVAGRFGNLGQADYAAANEVLCKLAASLDRRWPGRVLALVWGPWSGIGMVSELEQHLDRRGLQLIPPDVGPVFLADELVAGAKGDCEVVIAGDVGPLAHPRRDEQRIRAYPGEPTETAVGAHHS